MATLTAVLFVVFGFLFLIKFNRYLSAVVKRRRQHLIFGAIFFFLYACH